MPCCPSFKPSTAPEILLAEPPRLWPWIAGAQEAGLGWVVPQTAKPDGLLVFVVGTAPRSLLHGPEPSA